MLRARKLTRSLLPLFTALLLLEGTLLSQVEDPTRFAAQVKQLVSEADTDGGDIIFTGSSSVRMWKDVDSTYPSVKILNHGFGGSTMNDLLHYLDELVLQHNPRQVFIYEGDNDVAANIAAEQVLTTTSKVVEKILTHNPDCSIVFISPKPSVARWHLLEQYQALNNELAAFCQEKENVQFADVWTPMLDKDGMVFKDIFLADNLHMNAKGYAIWTKALKPYLDVQ